jgi:hypothetical protein
MTSRASLCSLKSLDTSGTLEEEPRSLQRKVRTNTRQYYLTESKYLAPAPSSIRLGSGELCNLAYGPRGLRPVTTENISTL